MADGADDSVSKRAAGRLAPSIDRSWKLRLLAEDLAWGRRLGHELTGRLFAIAMIGGSDLGYTNTFSSTICVNPLPMLRQEQSGRDIFRGLILHELGHHKYHRGPEADEVFQRARDENLHPLLNLVADEHLERNLRAIDRSFGDKFKRLAAYAFQYAEREISVDDLFQALGPQVFRVLSRIRLRPARQSGCVRVGSGHVLRSAQQAGQSFPRFLRALRMGQGNRSGDPKVGEALALFGPDFRHSEMADLLRIARELKRIFAAETSILDAVGQDAMVAVDNRDLQIHGEGITDADIEGESQRSTSDRQPRLPRAGARRGGRGLNVGPDEQFAEITEVTKIPFDPHAHAVLARQVDRHARRFRRYLEELGLSRRPQRRRLRGHRLDRGRIRDLIVRGDPRILIARELRVETDLFLGVVIDCSGSMTGSHLEKAKLFGALLAESARGLSGVDVRLFGFTDTAIYDAGDAARPALHGLETNGGNNDAAGLWHSAQAAIGSRRRARLLVMVSDGSPTDCTVAALRALVKKLTARWNICCAQVAVRPLEEICFPHYVVVDGDNLDQGVRRFGTIVARLVRRAMTRG
jgi:hypothetical protein